MYERFTGWVWFGRFLGGCYEIAITVDLRAFLHDDAPPHRAIITASPSERSHPRLSTPGEVRSRARDTYTCNLYVLPTRLLSTDKFLPYEINFRHFFSVVTNFMCNLDVRRGPNFFCSFHDSSIVTVAIYFVQHYQKPFQIWFLSLNIIHSKRNFLKGLKTHWHANFPNSWRTMKLFGKWLTYIVLKII